MRTDESAHRPTHHYRARAATRALRSDVQEFLMTWGTETRAAGASHITLVRRDLPIDLRNTETAARAEGWIIVAGDDGSLITCYRRTKAWRFVRAEEPNAPTSPLRQILRIQKDEADAR